MTLMAATPRRGAVAARGRREGGVAGMSHRSRVRGGGEAVEKLKALQRKYDKRLGARATVGVRQHCGGALMEGTPMSFCSLWRAAQVGPELMRCGA